ncbi:MAG: DNA mismatch repair protein MutS [Bacteroidota bacterium]
MAAKSGKETPLMKQYNAIKTKYPGALLLFRVGDFYETFGEDALKASKTLDIVLTKRANGSASEIELAGFPHHAMDTYLPKLVRAGYRVAICDQLEDPKTVKGIVKRGVTELVTPGLSLHDNVLEQRKNNYLASIHLGKEKSGVAFLDLSTGEFFLSSGNMAYVDKLIRGFAPSEIIFCKKHRGWYTDSYGDEFANYALEDWIFSHDFGYEKLVKHFKVKNLKGYGVQEQHEGIIAAGAILFYLEDTEHKNVSHIKSISRIEEDKYVWLDRFTIRNLELVQPAQFDGTSLLDLLNHTITPMGGRLLRKWIVLPLKDKPLIDQRLDVVEEFTQHEELVEGLLEALGQIADLERLVGKIATNRVNPRELNQLKKSLLQVPILIDFLQQKKSVFGMYQDLLASCEQLTEKLEKTINNDAPLLLHQGNVIADGLDEELDELRAISTSGKDYLAGIREREIEQTGISSLKIAYNKVFGYYLEVSNAHKDKVPEDWIRKQTLVNAERYITEELKQYEEKILNAESQINSIELRLYQQLVQYAQQYAEAIQQNAQVIAQLDCLLCFAQLSNQFNYTRPTISTDKLLDIKAGRHPVIEQALPDAEEYVANDVFLDTESQQIMIITGPNMAGKSALLRQTALITLMAQIGCFVPAGYAKIGLVDKIFTRVGASDNLSKGESTFMVEMTETASILNNLSDRSLILMDEIGRGTSTYDGISIAWSIVEHLHQHKNRAKTLFATHYHELNQLADKHPRVKNFNVSVKELENKVIFLRKLVEGGSAHSFGIHVAQMAGMPLEIVIKAEEVLKELESSKTREETKTSLSQMKVQSHQMNLFEIDPKLEKVLTLLNKTDINATSPVEALLRLNEIKDLLRG